MIVFNLSPSNLWRCHSTMKYISANPLTMTDSFPPTLWWFLSLLLSVNPLMMSNSFPPTLWLWHSLILFVNPLTTWLHSEVLSTNPLVMTVFNFFPSPLWRRHSIVKYIFVNPLTMTYSFPPTFWWFLSLLLFINPFTMLNSFPPTLWWWNSLTIYVNPLTTSLHSEVFSVNPLTMTVTFP